MTLRRSFRANQTWSFDFDFKRKRDPKWSGPLPLSVASYDNPLVRVRWNSFPPPHGGLEREREREKERERERERERDNENDCKRCEKAREAATAHNGSTADQERKTLRRNNMKTLSDSEIEDQEAERTQDKRGSVGGREGERGRGSGSARNRALPVQAIEGATGWSAPRVSL